MSEPAFHELEALLSTLAESTLDLSQRARLRQILRDDPLARRMYCRYIELHVMLEWENGTVAAPALEETDSELSSAAILTEVLEQERRARALREAAAVPQPPAAHAITPTPPSPPARHYVIPKPVFYGAIAALIAVAAVLIWPQRDAPPERPDTTPPVARVTPPITPSIASPSPAPAVASLEQSFDAVWANQVQMRQGDSLTPGPYSLARGIAKIVYESQARIIIEAPCTFVLDSDMQFTLLSGRIVGVCSTPQSRGFIVQTPSARIEDLGTEFGVSLAADGASQTHVFAGNVAVTALFDGRPTATTRILQANEAATIDAHGSAITPIAPHESIAHQFVRNHELEAMVRAPQSPYHRWLSHQFALRRDPNVVLHLNFNDLPDLASDGELPLRRGVTITNLVGLDPVAGRFSEHRAAHYQADDDRVELHFAETYDQITLAGWFFIDDLPYSQNALFTSFDWAVPGGIHWQITAEQIAFDQHTPLGVTYEYQAARYDFARSNRHRWIHLAVTYNTHTGEVILFVDGQPIHEATMTDTTPIRLGAAGIGYWRDDGVNAPAVRTFRGRIDAFTIWKVALPRRQVAELFRAGKPR